MSDPIHTAELYRCFLIYDSGIFSIYLYVLPKLHKVAACSACFACCCVIVRWPCSKNCACAKRRSV